MEEAKRDIPKNKRVLRLRAFIPAVFSLVAFVLTIILVISGSKPGAFEEYNLLALNTSKLGQDLIQFTPTTPSSTSSSATDPLTAIGDFFQGLLHNSTASIDNGLNDAEAQLIKNVLTDLGIQEFYSLHLLDICSGNLTNTDGYNVSKCVKYSDTSAGISNLTNSVPSSLTLLTTNVSIPLLSSLSTSSSYISSTITTFSKTIFAFYVLALVGIGLTMVFSLLSVFLSRSHPLLYLLLFSSSLASIFQLVASIVATILISLVVSTANMLGNGIDLYATKGTRFLVLTWVSWGLTGVVNGYWGLVWWVEVRGWAFKRRRRTRAEIGNWRGIWGEMRRDLRLEKKGL